MKRYTSFTVLLTLLSISTIACAADLQPIMTTRGKSLLSESFEAATLPESWESLKGTWGVAAGALQGSEKASDKKPADAGTQSKTPPASGAQGNHNLEMGAAESWVMEERKLFFEELKTKQSEKKTSTSASSVK